MSLAKKLRGRRMPVSDILAILYLIFFISVMISFIIGLVFINNHEDFVFYNKLYSYVFIVMLLIGIIIGFVL